MSGTHFYLTLPSNSSLSIYKTTSYRVKLPQVIDLNGNWEVGLYTISYPNTWYTLQNLENHIYYSKDGFFFETATVDYGYYETTNELVKSVNASLKKETKNDNVRLSYNVRTEKVTYLVYFPSEQKGEYFDSYGNNPNYYGKTFENDLNEHSYEWNFNKRKLQSNWSNVCGQYCIFYLSRRVGVHSMNKIVRMFDNNTMLNDAKVSHFVKTHFRVGVKSPNVNLTQFSKKLVQ